MSFVKSLVNDGWDEGRAVEEHPLARSFPAVVLCNLVPPVDVAFPQLWVPDFLDLMIEMKNY